MNTYLLLFKNLTGAGDYISTPEDMARDMPAWQAWIGEMAMKGKLVSTHPVTYQGSRVAKTGVTVGPDVDATGILTSGYLICKATSEQEVQEWSQHCPILQYPKGYVEIRGLIDFPVQA